MDTPTVGSRPDSSVLKKLDGSVKKNSAFVKKLVSLIKIHTFSFVTFMRIHYRVFTAI